MTLDSKNKKYFSIIIIFCTRSMKLKKIVRMLSFILLPAASAFAGDGAIDTGDTAWIMVATALVMMMTPAGLALFYGGMSRYKNLLNTLAMTFMAYCVGSVVWVVWGYTMAFGPDIGGLFGGFDYLLLSGITPASVSGTIPTLVFVMFQMIVTKYPSSMLYPKIG